MTEALPTYTAEELASYPASELFHLLVRNEDRAPRILIDECARRGDEMLDVLEPTLAKEYYWSEDTTDGEWWLRFHAVMILGLVPTARAGELLVAFMRRTDQAQDETLEEWLSGYWPALFRNKPDSVLQPLRALAEDAAAGPYMRSEAAQAVVACAGWADAGASALDSALAWAAKIAFSGTQDPDLRMTLGSMLLDYARPGFRRKLEELADMQTSPVAMFDRAEITQVYFSRGREPQWEWENFKDPWVFYEPEVMARRQLQWAEAEAELAQPDLGSDETYVRETPKIGRNDPCPCGSGKKYKKCCGGSV